MVENKALLMGSVIPVVAARSRVSNRPFVSRQETHQERTFVMGIEDKFNEIFLALGNLQASAVERKEAQQTSAKVIKDIYDGIERLNTKIDRGRIEHETADIERFNKLQRKIILVEDRIERIELSRKSLIKWLGLAVAAGAALAEAVHLWWVKG